MFHLAGRGRLRGRVEQPLRLVGRLKRIDSETLPAAQQHLAGRKIGRLGYVRGSADMDAPAAARLGMPGRKPGRVLQYVGRQFGELVGIAYHNMAAGDVDHMQPEVFRQCRRSAGRSRPLSPPESQNPQKDGPKRPAFACHFLFSIWRFSICTFWRICGTGLIFHT